MTFKQLTEKYSNVQRLPEIKKRSTSLYNFILGDAKESTMGEYDLTKTEFNKIITQKNINTDYSGVELSIAKHFFGILSYNIFSLEAMTGRGDR